MRPNGHDYNESDLSEMKNKLTNILNVNSQATLK